MYTLSVGTTSALVMENSNRSDNLLHCICLDNRMFVCYLLKIIALGGDNFCFVDSNVILLSGLSWNFVTLTGNR